jgi:hypothetical protein
MRARAANKVFMPTAASEWAPLLNAAAADSEAIVSNATMTKEGLQGSDCHGGDVGAGGGGGTRETMEETGTGGVYIDRRYVMATMAPAVAKNSRAEGV